MRSTSIRPAVLALSALAFIAQAAFGQSRQTFHESLFSSVGLFGTDRDGTGISLKAGGVYANEFLGLVLVPIDLGALSPDPDSQYGEIALSDGSTQCHEKATGHLVRESNCKSRLVVAASAEAWAALPIGKTKSIGAGAGYRVGSTSGVYGMGTFYFGPMNSTSWNLSLRVGQSFFDLGVGGTFRLK